MRLWMVDPRILCNKHLLGEHLECHMFVGALRLGRSVEGYLSKGLLEIHSLRSRHEALVKEMEKRGMNHRSPLPYIASLRRTAGKVDPEESKRELLKRCSFCGVRHRNLIKEN